MLYLGIGVLFDMKKGDFPMLMPTILMAIVAFVLIAIGYQRGEHVAGLKQSMAMVIQILPLLSFAFIIAGMVHVLMPGDIISKWIGEGSGLKGILIGTVAGAFTPGGSLCKHADCSRTIAYWCEHGYYGSLYDRLVTMGSCSIADGSRNTWMEIYTDTTIERADSSTYCRIFCNVHQ